MGLLTRLLTDANTAFDQGPIRTTYAASISAPAWAAPAAAGSSRGGGGAIVASAVASVLAAALVAVVAALLKLSKRRRQRHRDLLGRLVAPRPGPDTTLLISDVQSSTTLWEELPPEVMDAALALHHATVRRLAARHDGWVVVGPLVVVLWLSAAAASDWLGAGRL